VVETGGLENRLALTGYGGSNPSPSANAFFTRFSSLAQRTIVNHHKALKANWPEWP
jgi:hypothetical protein